MLRLFLGGETKEANRELARISRLEQPHEESYFEHGDKASFQPIGQLPNIAQQQAQQALCEAEIAEGGTME